MPKKTTVLTAIPYVNSTPHIGNVLTTLSGDITARYLRMRGEDVHFQAGTDENGLKIQEAAQTAGEEVHAFVDRIAQRFVDIFAGLKISYDDFVRTTEPRHVRAAQELFRRLREAGHIYEGTYEGWYDVATETFFKAEELVDGKSPDGNDVRWVSEKNYFFRLSAFEPELAAAYADGRLRVIPETRQNEVLSFLKQGLRDVCVSRSNPGWGIPVPGDEGQVIYVWFDALINYLTTTGWPDDPDWQDMWPPVVQWLGKDILTRFHATLWPAMLMGVGAFGGVTPERPFSVVAHGWILLGQEKISKSKGNVVEPLILANDLSDRTGTPLAIAVDALRWYEASTMSFEGDSTFTYDDFDKRYNSDLANDLGNALNRSLSMAHKFLGEGATVPSDSPDPDALRAIAEAKSSCEAAMADFRIDRYAEASIGLVRWLNKAIDTWAPWALAKGRDPRLGQALRSMLLTLRSAEGLFRPLIPGAADEIAAQLGLDPLNRWADIGLEGSLPAGRLLGQPRPIFPRLEVAKEGPKPALQAGANSQEKKMDKQTEPSPPETGTIDIKEFGRVSLRVGRVIDAEPVEGSEKLVKLQVRIGEEPRQILAGIAKSYSPMDLIGRQVVVVANLKPAKLMGHESQGMLLAADGEGGAPILLQPDSEAPDGASVH